MIRLFVVVNDITAVMAAGYTVIRVYTDVSETGTFVTLDGTITLVAGTESYEYTDTLGTSATWYKTAYYGLGPAESSKSDARRGETSKAYATVLELRNAIDKTARASDVELAAILDAATGAIDNFCGRPDGFVADVTASARLYTADGGPVLWIDECAQVTLVAVKDSPTEDTYTAWAPGDWLAFSGDPKRPDFQPLAKGKPYTAIMATATGDESHFTSGRYSQLAGFRPSFIGHRGVPTVQVTARWGYADTVPDPIRQACIVQAARWFRRGLSQWADTVGNPEMGQLFYRRAVDPAIQMLLQMGRFVRPAIG